MLQKISSMALLLAIAIPAMASDLVLRNAPVSVYFSPRGGCTEAVVGAIDAARTEVLVSSYSFTSAPIASALKRAHDRGIRVLVILDKSQQTERYSGLTYLVRAGIPVWVDSSHPIAHNKLVLVDRQVTVTGSFNHSKAAEVNAENLLVIQSPELTAYYVANWETHRQHSSPAN